MGLGALGRLAFPPLFAAFFMACGAPPEPGAAAGSGIEGGEVDMGDPEVGILVYADGNACTATLIAPDVLLTAGHCVIQDLEGFYTEGGTSSLIPGKTRHPVTAKVAHPQYRPDASDCPNQTPDVALVRLASPIAGVTPMAFARATDRLPQARDEVVAVGYGVHHTPGSPDFEGDPGAIKRRATERVLDAPAASVHVERVTGIVNHGDSGGPLVFGQKIFGTASCITSDFPSDYTAYYGRVDVAAPWIATMLARWGHSPTQ